MLIEVLGASGVGKTTICNLVKPDFKDLIFYQSDTVSKLDKEDERYCVDFLNDRKFLDGCIDIIARSKMAPTQKSSAISMLVSTFSEKLYVDRLSESGVVASDEFLLHRSFSTLIYSVEFEKDVSWFFKNVPVPEAAIFFTCDVNTLFERVKVRGKLVNTYRYLDSDQMLVVLKRSQKLFNIAAEVLTARGVFVQVLDVSESVENSVSKAKDCFFKALR